MDFETLPELIAGRYRPVRPLGAGGMGVVFVVEHVNTGELLAMKVLRRAARGRIALERFKREARISARIKSEHVVRVLDADVASELDDARFLVMELLEGANLDEATAGKPQSIEDVLSWLGQIAAPLDRAHALGIVHRDLKPENIFLTRREDGSPLLKILDFGIARVADGGDETATGDIVGTPRYMAPEQATGEAEAIGPHTDVWAIGLIAYRLLCGCHYWPASTTAQLLAQIIYEPVTRPSDRDCDLGDAFDAWMLQSCDRSPGSRWGSVGEQVEALTKALREGPAVLVVGGEQGGDGAGRGETVGDTATASGSGPRPTVAESSDDTPLEESSTGAATDMGPSPADVLEPRGVRATEPGVGRPPVGSQVARLTGLVLIASVALIWLLLGGSHEAEGPTAATASGATSAAEQDSMLPSSAPVAIATPTATAGPNDPAAVHAVATLPSGQLPQPSRSVPRPLATSSAAPPAALGSVPVPASATPTSSASAGVGPNRSTPGPTTSGGGLIPEVPF